MQDSAKITFTAIVLLVSGASAPGSLLADGAAIYGSQCAHCHALTPDDTATIGPRLENIVGKAVGSVEGFQYSAGLKDVAVRGLVWNEGTLNSFLADPRDLIPATTMGFPGLSSADERKELIYWLKETASKGVSAADTAANITLDPEVEKILAIEADAEFGQYLAAECLTCHTTGNSVASVPQINGLAQHYLVRSLLDYRSGQRDNAVMKLMAQNLGDEEIAAISSFFANNKP